MRLIHTSVELDSGPRPADAMLSRWFGAQAPAAKWESPKPVTQRVNVESRVNQRPQQHVARRAAEAIKHDAASHVSYCTRSNFSQLDMATPVAYSLDSTHYPYTRT